MKAASSEGFLMNEKSHLSDRIYRNKTQIVIVSVILFILELQIFAIAMSRSGVKHTLQVLNDEGVVIYETNGKELTEFKKYYFEQTFGPFETFRKKLVTHTEPFPFRAWFSAAVGIPVGFVLLFAFVIRAIVSLFGKSGEKERPEEPDTLHGRSGFERMIGHLSHLNIFVIGTILFTLVFSFWVIPNLISTVGQAGLEVIDRYKWFFGIAGGALLLLAAWIIYLRYLLAKHAIETEAEIKKYQLQLSFDQGERGTPLKLEERPKKEIVDAAFTEFTVDP